MPQHLKTSINQAHLENGTYEQNVSHFERELEPNGLEAPDEMQVNTVTHQATQQKSETPKPTCHHCKKPSHYPNQGRQLTREKTKAEITRIVLTITTILLLVVKQTLTPAIKFPAKTMQEIQIIKKTQHLDLSTHPLRPVLKLTTPQRNDTLEQTQRTDHLPEIVDRKDKTRSNREMLKATRTEISKLQPKLFTRNATSSPGSACDRPEIIKIPKLPTIPEVVWKQLSETSTNKCTLNITNNDSALY